MKRYFPGVDVLRIVAAFGIVGCHLALPKMTVGAEFVKRFTDYNVGVFAAISGFFFFATTVDSFWIYFRKRVTRLLLPYFVWSLIFLLFTNSLHYLTNGHFDRDLQDWNRLCEVIFWGASSAHLWFLIVLFYIQCLLFFFLKFEIRGVVLLVLSILTTLICDTEPSLYVKCLWRIFSFTLLGGWLWKMARSPGRCSRRCPSYVLIGSLIFIGGTVGAAVDDHFRYLWEWCMAMPLCWGAVLWNSTAIERHSAFWRKAGDMMFFVFLVHLFFTVAMREVIVRLCTSQNVVIFIVDQIVCFALSCVTAWAFYRLLTQFKILGILVGKTTHGVKQ